MVFLSSKRAIRHAEMMEMLRLRVFGDMEFLRIQTRINTLLRNKFPAWFSCWRQNQGENFPNMQSFTDFTGMHISLTRPDASWRFMLVSQPPIPNLQVVVADVSRTGQARYRYKVIHFGNNGLRMGFLYSVVQSFMAPNRYFNLDWAQKTWTDPMASPDWFGQPLPELLEDMFEHVWMNHLWQPMLADVIHLILKANDHVDFADSHPYLSGLRPFDPSHLAHVDQ